jgi:hypothetical protein
MFSLRCFRLSVSTGSLYTQPSIRGRRYPKPAPSRGIEFRSDGFQTRTSPIFGANIGGASFALARNVDDSAINVNCGRCGIAFTMRLADIGDKRTLECASCVARQSVLRHDDDQRAVSRSDPTDAEHLT